MRPERSAILILVLLGFLAAPGLPAQTSLSPEHEVIDFLVGEWRTLSEFPDGREVEGDLSYRWVLGGAWMKVEFYGEPPDGSVWESHVMQRWNQEEEAYEAWAFGAEGPPIRYRGTAPEPGVYRIRRTTEEGITTGIDYQATEDGAVYQENWVMEEGRRRVTLRTTYQPQAP